MARRKIGYEELMQRKGTYAVKAALTANMARFDRREAKIKAELDLIVKARAEHQADFDKVVNAVNAAAVASLAVPPKKAKTKATEALAPVPAATEAATEIVELETDTETLTAISAEPFTEPLPEVPAVEIVA